MAESKVEQVLSQTNKDKIDQFLVITSVEDNSFDVGSETDKGSFVIEGYFNKMNNIDDHHFKSFLQNSQMTTEQKRKFQAAFESSDKENKFHLEFTSSNGLKEFVDFYRALLQIQRKELLSHIEGLETRIARIEKNIKDEKKYKKPNVKSISIIDSQLKQLNDEKLPKVACLNCIDQSYKILTTYVQKRLTKKDGNKVAIGLKFQSAFTMLTALSQEDETPLQQYHIRVAKLKVPKEGELNTLPKSFYDNKHAAAGRALRGRKLGKLDGETVRLFHSKELTRHEQKAKVGLGNKEAFLLKSRLVNKELFNRKKFTNVNEEKAVPIVVGVMPLFTKDVGYTVYDESVPEDLKRIEGELANNPLGAVYICVDGKSEARQLMQGPNGIRDTAVYSCPAAWEEVTRNEESWYRATYSTCGKLPPLFEPEERAQFSTLVNEFNDLAVKGWVGAKAHLLNNRFVCFEMPTEDFEVPSNANIEAYAVSIEIGCRLMQRESSGMFSHCKSGEGRGPLPAVMLKLISDPKKRADFLNAPNAIVKKQVISEVFESIKAKRSQVSLSAESKEKNWNFC